VRRVRSADERDPAGQGNGEAEEVAELAVRVESALDLAPSVRLAAELVGGAALLVALVGSADDDPGAGKPPGFGISAWRTQSDGERALNTYATPALLRTPGSPITRKLPDEVLVRASDVPNSSSSPCRGSRSVVRKRHFVPERS
jgi:hypothetical protein